MNCGKSPTDSGIDEGFPSFLDSSEPDQPDPMIDHLKSQECFQIAREINRLYEERIDATSSSDDGIRVKLIIFENWVKDLREQNDNLKDVVIKLEEDVMKQCQNCCELKQFHQRQIEVIKKMMNVKEKMFERQKIKYEQMLNSSNQNKAKGQMGSNNGQRYKSNNYNKKENNGESTKYEQEYEDFNNNHKWDNNFEPCNCKNRTNYKRDNRDATKYNDVLNTSQKEDRTTELLNQVKGKEKLICFLREQLKAFKYMPGEIKPLVVKIKGFVKTMSEILRKSSNEDSVMKLLTCLECISLCLNELQLIIDNYKDNQREQISLEVTDNQSSSVTEIFRRKGNDSSASSMSSDMKQLMKEVQDQGALIDCLRSALAEAHDHNNCLKNSSYTLKHKNDFAGK